MAPPSPSRIASLFRLLGRLLRWSLWLLLAAALILQLRILVDGGLRLPAFARDALARRLAAQGFSFRADAVWLDPRGRILVIAPRIGLASASGAPAEFASARAVALQLRRREFFHGKIQPTRIEVTGLALSLPALHSPTGADQPLLEGGEFLLTREAGSPDWRLDQSSARILSIPTAFTGALPTSTETPKSKPYGTIAIALRQMGSVYARLAELPLDAVHSLRIELTPASEVVVHLGIPRMRLPAKDPVPASLRDAVLEDVLGTITVPLAAFSHDTLELGELRLHTARLAFPAPLSVVGDNLDLRLSLSAHTLHLGQVSDFDIDASVAVAAIRKIDAALPPAPLVASFRYFPEGIRRPLSPLSADISARLADAPWSAAFSGDPAARSGAVSASGELTPALLEVIRPFLPEKARPVLELSDPVALDLAAEFAPGGAPARVDARAAAGRAVAGHVPFDRAAATLRYEPGRRLLRADDLVLVQADSLAAGSYEMDTKTLAFRFLLGGRLRPMAIQGWFSGWWGRFWDNFAFGLVPPDADVDVQGAWHDPDRTTVFVGASSGPMQLRGLPLDTLSTRIHVGPQVTDLVGFHATQAGYSASGAFARFTGPDHDDWARMSFDVRSDFPLEALPLLFPEEGPEIAAPFQLSAPPRVHLVGEAFGPASSTPGRQRYTLDLATPGPLRYEGFPLDRLSTRIERHDDEIHLANLRAGFADGLASGQATLSGPSSDRWLAFDLTLEDAHPDLALLRWREFQATRPDYVPPAKETKTEKALGGRFRLSLAATGPAARPLAFAGRGFARIQDADLAQIRLLGGLSTLLSELGIGLTTVKLTGADARFGLDQNRLVFDSLQLTGPSALVEADGAYILPQGALDFSAKIRPFEQRGGILSSTVDFVLTPLSSVLEVELGGTLDDPDWTFTYGPTRLFRRITGAKPKTPPPPPPVFPPSDNR